MIRPLIIIVVAALAWLGYNMYRDSVVNYAEEVAWPLEEGLVKAGATKVCSRGHAGRGPDNTNPWYMAMYELPGNKATASQTLQTAASESGYSLSNVSSTVNAGDSIHYADRASKDSPYSALEDGKVELLSTVYEDNTHMDKNGSLCTVTTSDNPPKDKTTIDITVNLPAFKQ